MSFSERAGGMRRRELLQWGAGVVLGGGLLAGCGGNSSQPQARGLSKGPGDRGTPVRGGALKIAVLSLGASETLDVRSAVVPTDYIRVQNLLDPLFFQTTTGVAPGLAASAEPNAAATVWTFKLRDGVTWHDGKPFTADDVLYTIGTWNTAASSYYGVMAPLVDFRGVRKRGNMTIEVPLRRPMASFPALLSWGNLYVVQAGTKDFKKPVGTGPFRYESFQPGVSSTFSANQDYWRGRPHVDSLVIDSSFTDEGARINALLSKQAHIVPGVDPSLARAHKSSGQLVLGNQPGAGYVGMGMRVDDAPFTDPRVVQAFKLLTDRQQIVDGALAGFGTPGNDLPGATLQYWDSAPQPHDPEKAKSLLKAAGQADLVIPLATAAAAPGMNEAATLWSAQAAAIGLRAPVRRGSVSTYYTAAAGVFTKRRPFSMNFWNTFPASLGTFYDMECTGPTAV
jgi:peptide/nickel transport system substrate-binding protein